MINLLPLGVKKDIAYARKNKVLVSWILILWIFIVLLILVMGFGMFFINQRAVSLDNIVTFSEKRVKDQKLEDYQKKAEGFSSDLNSAVKLLENQLLFSKIIKTIGAVLPPGVTLGTLNYSADEDILTLNITGADQKAITTAYTNISSSKEISKDLFSKADLIKIDCSPIKSECTGSIVVLLSKNSEYYPLYSAVANKKDKN